MIIVAILYQGGSEDKQVRQSSASRVRALSLRA